jgi:purine-nucleoside phosphorylase
MSTDPLAVAEVAANVIAERTGFARHDVAVVLGSGWAAAADVLGPADVVADMAAFAGHRRSPGAGAAGPHPRL